MAEFRINIIVDPARARRGVGRVDRDLNRLERSADRLGRSLRNAFAGVSAGLAVRELLRLVDTYNLLENRLRVVTPNQQNLNAVFDELFGIAQRTRSGLEGTVNLYSRLAIASKELGVNQQQLLNFTESLSQAIVISGASAIEANNALIQLSQGLASGTLRGDELRSVLEQLPVVADVIAEELGVTRGQLRALGAEGKITARDIITAFENAEEQLAGDFAKTVPTIAQSLVVLRNEAIRFFSELDNATGITTAIVTSLQFLTANFDLLGNVLITVAGLLGVRLVAALAGYAGAALTAVKAQVALNIALGATPGIANLFNAALKIVVTNLRALTAVIAANPLGALAIAVLAAVNVLFQLRNETVSLGNETASVGSIIAVVWGRVVTVIQNVIAFFGRAFTSLKQNSLDAINAVLGNFLDIEVGAKDVVNFIIAVFKSGIDAIVAQFRVLLKVAQGVFDGIRRSARLLSLGLQAAVIGEFDLAGQAFGGITQTFDFDAAVDEARVGARTIADNFSRDFLGELGAQITPGIQSILREADARDADLAANRLAIDDAPVTPTPTPTTGGGGGGKNRKDFQDIINGLTQENDLLRVNSQEREVLQALLQAEQQLKRGLSQEEAAQITTLVQQNQLLQAQSSILEELNGPTETSKLQYAAINGLLEQGSISLEQYNQKLRDLAVAATEANNTITGGFLNGLARVFQQANDLGKNISDVVVGAFDKATNAIVDFAKTGEFSMRQLFASIAEELLRMATNQLFAQLLGGIFGAGGLGGGGGGGGLGSLLGFANGGSIMPGGQGTTDSQMVAFAKSPNERVDILTPQQQRAQASAASGAAAAPPPQVNNSVNVAAVISPADIAGAFDGDEGETVVVNILERNRSTVQQLANG